MIRDLLVHLDHTPASPARLEAALALAAACGAQVTALYLLAEPFLRGVAGLHAPIEVIREHLAHAEAEAEAVFATARELAARRNLTLATRRETGSVDRLPMLLAREARASDLVVVGQPDPQAGGTDEALLAEAAFMDSGRPALVVPHAGGRPVTMPPKRAIVAWDGSREAARAVHDALPLLRLAEEAIVLVVDAKDLGARVDQQPGADVAAHLGRHEVGTRVKRVTSGGTGTGELILAQAGEEGADLLVIGGYGHSRLREMLVGGVTRHVLERATVSVLFAH
jgi:nucleotide-binding universal stress UspA family protein